MLLVLSLSYLVVRVVAVVIMVVDHIVLPIITNLCILFPLSLIHLICNLEGRLLLGDVAPDTINTAGLVEQMTVTVAKKKNTRRQQRQPQSHGE